MHAIERDQIDIITDTSLFFSLSCPFYICHIRERKNQEKGRKWRRKLLQGQKKKKKIKIKGLTDKIHTRNITYHASAVTHSERTQLLNQAGLTIWLTGLSASGKSTIAVELEHQLLRDRDVYAYRLDGDNVRFGLNKDLGFSEKDRNENIRRISEVAKLFADSGCVAITSFISPYRADRDTARALHEVPTHGEEKGLPFVEVFVDVPVEVAEKRDPKGLYKKAREGVIKEFTGISAPYEEPARPEVHIRSHEVPVQEAVKQIIDYLDQKGYLPKKKE